MPNNWSAIPDILKQRPQWCVSTLAPLPTGKPDKAPRRANGTLASVTDPSTWCTFEEAIASGYPAIGFVLTADDPFTVIDLDQASQPEIVSSQVQVFNALEGTYAERSQSGHGCHIITAAKIGGGIRRTGLEVYDQERYIITTGDVVRAAPIADLNGTIHELVATLGGIDSTLGLPPDQPEQYNDAEILHKLSSAANGQKFSSLFGTRPTEADDWSRLDSQLAQFFAFHTRNHEQALRLFRMSQLYRGIKGGYNTVEKYERDYLLRRTFADAWARLDADNEQRRPFIEHGRSVADTILSAWRAEQAATIAQAEAAVARLQPPAPTPPSAHIPTPPGLLGGLAHYIYKRGHTLCWEAALGGAIGLLAGITGRQFNTYTRSGLTQYVVIIGQTGVGKENASSGVDAIINSMPIGQQVFARRYIGGNPQSAPALLKDLGEDSVATHSTLVRYGEMGLMLKQLTDPKANGTTVGLRRALLDLFSKSGADGTIDAITYSERKSNTKPVQAPNFTFVGDTTPSRFYSAIDADMAAEGFLPRLTILESDMLSAVDNTDPVMLPEEWVLQALDGVVSITTTHKQNNHFEFVQPTAEAHKALEAYKRKTRKRQNAASDDYEREILNRAHLKVLRLATLVAVGCNWVETSLTVEHVDWAVNVIDRGHEKLLSRFDTGEAGGGDAALEGALLRVVADWLISGETYKRKYTRSNAVATSKALIPRRYLRKRLMRLGVFREHKAGAMRAAETAISVALNDKILKEVPIHEMSERGIHKSTMVLTLGEEYVP